MQTWIALIAAVIGAIAGGIATGLASWVVQSKTDAQRKRQLATAIKLQVLLIAEDAYTTFSTSQLRSWQWQWVDLARWSNLRYQASEVLDQPTFAVIERWVGLVSNARQGIGVAEFLHDQEGLTSTTDMLVAATVAVIVAVKDVIDLLPEHDRVRLTNLGDALPDLIAKIPPERFSRGEAEQGTAP